MKNKIVEEIVEEYFKQWEPFEVEGDHQQFSEGIFISDVEEAKERLLTTITQLHQELQKAQAETIHKVLAVVSSKQNQFTSTYERGYQDAVKNILESIHHYQSELDQPNNK